MECILNFRVETTRINLNNDLIETTSTKWLKKSDALKKFESISYFSVKKIECRDGSTLKLERKY